MTTQITVIAADKFGTDSEYVCAFWLTAPANGVVPIPAFKSAVTTVDAPTLSALQAGTIIEQLWSTGLLPSGTSIATLKTLAQNAYTAAQTAITNKNPPIKMIGATYDGTTWTAAV